MKNFISILLFLCGAGVLAAAFLNRYPEGIINSLLFFGLAALSYCSDRKTRQ